MKTLIVLAAMAGYFGVGAVQARKMYVRMHHEWWDRKIADRKAWLARKRKSEEPEETLRVIRKDWETGKEAQGMVIGLCLITFVFFPVVVPLFALARDDVHSDEELKLVNEALEAEIERLRRQS